MVDIFLKVQMKFKEQKFLPKIKKIKYVPIKKKLTNKRKKSTPPKQNTFIKFGPYLKVLIFSVCEAVQ